MSVCFRSVTRLGTRSFFSSSRSLTKEVDVRLVLRENLKTAMKSKDTKATSTLRSVISEISRLDKLKGGPLKTPGIHSLIVKEIEKRNEAAAMYHKLNREDLASAEEAEITLLSSYIPPPLTPETVEQLLAESYEVIKTKKGSEPTQKELGQVLKEFNERAEGKGLVKAEEVVAKIRALLVR